MTFVIVPPNIFGDIVGLDTTLINPIPDTDGDGLPDDFETANSINPGGANVAVAIGTIATAHGEVSGSEAANASDQAGLARKVARVEPIICVKG